MKKNITMVVLPTILLLVGSTLAQEIVPPVKPEPRQSVKPEVKQSGGCNYALTFNTAGQQALLQSPSYPSNYPPRSNCKYTINSPPGTVIQMDCNEFNVEASSQCSFDVFYFSLTGDSTFRDALRTCGRGTFSRNSTSNALTVGFTSDEANPQSSAPYRFQCTLTAIPTSSSPAVTSAPPTSAPSTSRPPSCTCGERNEAMRIVGGTQAKVNEFPWRCNLYNPNMGVFCGCTIISNSWVLTAAHCTAAIAAGTTLYVDVGDHDISSATETQNSVVKVSRIAQHAAYNKETQDNDISLLRLETPLTFSRNIQPACMPNKMVGQSLGNLNTIASGWGTTSSGGSQSPVLKKVELPTLSTTQCQAYYGSSVTNNMFCTYQPGSDTCQGDSGGSLDYKDPTTGRYMALGVVSWGVGCAGDRQPGVYTKVPNYLSWIQSTMGGDTFCPL